ncbi:NAD(P)-binding domain-containing protein [Helicobacter mustelae]|uniref:Putative thioredoxin reductase, TrxB n=1 Tax=Helicobacter mustelae (strain ATCC 43772 / CCUG 25715 / CIP 103759 / LMG 18044 / NCTC 12198 / R85-136P) TaxID=679897 RepID=D3UHC0_HELM1|nr:NAD(P)/FAD-dependent oxidoreductase [Helicobacter mustelae]CBG39892.1 putative thioredoxin reductase, TrxB [Helicobacter mustelae 12198]SQH71403.1 thioredoxin reductase TrxB [Helicobacter mustelae]STP12531.1 thioredoxin reductase TrxB [Helicobacter mustelae]
MEKIYDIAIIGAGPGGIAASIEAKVLGIENIILFEKTHEHSATIRKFYKDGKRVDKDYKGQVVDLKGSIAFGDGDKESSLGLFDALLEQYSIAPKYGTDIEKVVKKDQYFELTSTGNETFLAKFVIIAIGKMGQPNKPDYKIPPTLLKKVTYNVNSIAEGEKVLVVGGGNSAVEYATALADITDTTLNYRRKEFNRINEINAKNLKDSMSKNLKTKLGLNIEKLEEKEGRAVAFFDDGTSEAFDKIVYAIGGSTPVDFLKKCGLELDSNDLPITKDYETSVENIFAIGDILSKNGASIAIAINQGYETILKIHTKMQ